MPQAGKLRHRLKVRKPPPKTERDSRGRRSSDYVDETVNGEPVIVSGDILPLSGTELEDARQLWATATATIVIRYPRSWTLTTKHRFEYQGRVFDVGYVPDPTELKEELHCLVSEAKA